MNSTKKRSIVKAVIWKIITIINSVLVTWAVTGSIVFAAEVGIIYNAIGLVLYYYHERWWNKSSWGKIPMKVPPE